MSAPRDTDALVEGVLNRQRAALGRALTLVESRRAVDRPAALALLERLGTPPRPAMRIGVTGVPGAGKSTLLDALGSRLLSEGRTVAVLAVDPSSQRTGGSILGDKTRMRRLVRAEGAFVRPQPSGGTLGGVARRSAEALLVLEAAGFDVIFVETVGVGQSEGAVSELTDLLLLVLIAGAGDELQGIKRGVLELADVAVLHKADGPQRERVERAARQLASALRLLRGQGAPPVLACSALEEHGIEALWDTIQSRWDARLAEGSLLRRRAAQRVHWMWHSLEDRLLETLRGAPAVQRLLPALEPGVRDGSIPPTAAAERLLEAFLGHAPPLPGSSPLQPPSNHPR